MSEINDLRIFAPEDDIECWIYLLDLLEKQGLIEFVQRPTRLYSVRGSDTQKRAYFKIKLLRELPPPVKYNLPLKK